MQRMLIIGCGDIARRALPELLRRYRVYALLRDTQGNEAQQLRAQGVRLLQGDLDRPSSLRRLRGLAELVLHAAPPANQGMHDRRSCHLLAALRRPVRARSSLACRPWHSARLGQPALQTTLRRLIYISTSGVYGDCGGAWVAETHHLQASTPRAQRRVDAERQLRDWGRRRLGPAVSILRVPGIYAPERLPRARIERGEPVLRCDDDVITNHMHADDLAHSVCMALRRGRPQRVYNASDDTHQSQPLYMADWFDAVADHFQLPRPPRLGRSEASQQLSAQVLSFMNESRRLDNLRLKCELGVRLRYPDVFAGLAAADLKES